MKCVRVGGWEGDCQNEAILHQRFCKKDKYFIGKNCSYADCDELVVCYCSCAGSLVCGAPLCKTHEGWCPRCKG